MKNYALSLSSSTYKNHIFEGFSRMQQNDEFVDMTLAADGHWVKVHRTLVGLASPYFREMLQSLPCQHPIMYLYGVSHEALGFILEYLYKGEVEIPSEKVQSFLKIAKDMQIAGLKNVVPPDEYEQSPKEKGSKNVFYGSKELSSTSARVNSARINDNKKHFLQQIPSIALAPIGGNENQKKETYPVHIPIPLHGTNAFVNSINLAPSELINISLDESAAINRDLKGSDLQHDSNINGTNNDIMDQSAKVNDYDIININQNVESDDLHNNRSVNELDEMINITLNESVAINSDFNLDMISKDVRNVNNINTPGKTINITLDKPTSSDNEKPVAQIEILSNTLISNKYTNADVNMTGTELPELYAQALANMNNQNMSNNHETSTNSAKSTNNKNILDISQLLDFSNDVPMYENNDADLLDTAVQNKNTENINGHCHNSTGEQIDVMSQPDTDSMLYTLSNRGALQLIMNRFMYYCHYQRDEGRKKRWRCIDYKDARCMAAIDTVGEEIVARKNAHCHPNHEEKIRRKVALKNTKFFSTMEMAQELKKNQKHNTS